MRSSSGSCTALLLVLVTFAWGCADRGPVENAVSTGAPTTIVLITVDGLVADGSSFGGNGLSTPNLEAVAREGNWWRDAWTASPMTRPAVATYLSGLAPDRHGVRDDLFTALPEGTPTLASLLAERGFRTAAFPDSDFLGFSSGLLQGFELVADPPPIPIRPDRWLPMIRPSSRVAADFATWLDGAAESDRLFGWAHFSNPLLAAMVRRPVGDEKRKGATGKGRQEQDANKAAGARMQADAIEDLDAALETILAAVTRRGDEGRTLLVVAGTLGDPSGNDSEPRGAGFSLAEAALQVPVIVRFPAEGIDWRSTDEPVWAPDVASTIAALAGATLPPEAEGIELTRPAPPDRVLFAWSWATRDQLGWRSLRAARSGAVKRLEGSEERTLSLDPAEDAVDPALARSLSEALALRTEPTAPRVPLAQVRPFLEARGLKLEPVPEQGRAFGTPEERSKVVRGLWLGRRAARLNLLGQAVQRFGAVQSNDPDCLAALLDFGMLRYFSGADDATELLGRAAELYPTDPEVLHWYAHSLWSRSSQDTEQLLLLVLPHQPRDADLLYDLACTHSLNDDLEASERYLRDAIAAGYRDWSHMETDGDLRALRESGRFAAVLRELGP